MIKDFKYYVEWAWSTCFGVLHQQKYCSVWDEKLNELLDKYSEEAVWDGYAVYLGDARVWWYNRFYSYGFLQKVRNTYQAHKTRPSVKTMIRLAKFQDQCNRCSKALFEQEYRNFIGGIE